MENNNSKTGEDQSGGENKVQKTFDANMGKLLAILGGEENLKPTSKVPKDKIDAIVEELLKDKQEAAVKKLKEGIQGLIETHIQFKREVAAKRKELDKLEQDKMGEFNKKAKEVFDGIDGLAELEKEYRESLTAAGKGSTEEK